MENILKYLQQIIEVDSPTGYTQNVSRYLYDTLMHMGYAPIVTPKGNVMVSVEGVQTDKQRYVTAHVDTLGAMVRAIKPDGRLKLDKIGGYAWNMIEGENCRIHTQESNRVIEGTILLHQTSVHVYRNVETHPRTQESIEVRLDEKVTSQEEVEALGIRVGDFVSFDPRFRVTPTGFVKSRFLDDKVSAAILLVFLEKMKTDNLTLPVTTHFAFSVFEEVGHGANSSIDEAVVEYLAVDMGAMGDDQATDEYTVSICAKDASGPYNLVLRQYLVDLAKENSIPYKIDIYPYYGSDASAAIRAGNDVKHALVGAGIESSHSYERTHSDSIDATYRLVAAYLLSELVTG